MKLDNNVLNLLINRETVRFIAQPDKDGFSKAVVISPLNHLYTLETVTNNKPLNYITTNNVTLDGITKEYKTVMTYLGNNGYSEL